MTAAADRALNGEQLTDLYVRLLLDERLRERLAAEGAAAVAAGDGELECLETIDLGELGTAARRFRSKIWRLGAGGGLASAFPRALRMIAAAGIADEELLGGFLGSAHFRGFRLVPYAGRGVSVEEAFASYLLDLAEAAGAGGPEQAGTLRETVTHELMICLFTALACERPLSFAIGVEGIVETGRGHAAVRRYAPASLAFWDEAAPGGDRAVSYAYFATPAGVARGAVSDSVAAAFGPAPTAAREAARRALARRGLW